jgi:hypothetical protein
MLAVRLSRYGWRGLGGLVIAVPIAAGLLAVWALPHLDGHSLELWRREMRLDRAASSLLEDESWGFERLEFMLTAAGQAMPTLLLALPGLVPAWRKSLGISPDLPNALALYALLGTALMFIADASAGRYAMPAIPALGVGAGLVFDRLCVLRSRLARPAMGLLCALAGFQAVTNYVVVPLRLDVVRQNRRTAQAIDAAIAGAPGRVLILGHTIDFNVLFYVEHPVGFLDGDAGPPAGPIWVLLGGDKNPPQAAQLPPLPEQPVLDLRSRDAERLRLYRL